VRSETDLLRRCDSIVIYQHHHVRHNMAYCVSDPPRPPDRPNVLIKYSCLAHLRPFDGGRRRADCVSLRSSLPRLALLTIDASQDISDANRPSSTFINQWVLGERRSRRSNDRGVRRRGRKETGGRDGSGNGNVRVQVMGSSSSVQCSYTTGAAGQIV